MGTHSNVLVSLMGPFALRVGMVRQPLHLTGNTKRLFMLLAGNFNHGLRRESVVEEIWPGVDPKNGSSNLNSGLWRIKKCLENLNGLSVSNIDDIVRFDVQSPAVVDADLMERAMTAVPVATSSGTLTDEVRAALTHAVCCCRGAFLEGCFDHWVLPIRERYSVIYVQALSILMRDAAVRRELDNALLFGQEILEIDPFREGTQREVMVLYVRNGQRVRAIRQYRGLKSLLQAELEVEPMFETTALYRRITENQSRWRELAAGQEASRADSSKGGLEATARSP